VHKHSGYTERRCIKCLVWMVEVLQDPDPELEGGWDAAIQEKRRVFSAGLDWEEARGVVDEIMWMETDKVQVDLIDNQDK